MIILKTNQVNNLCEFIENQLNKTPCDHSLKNTYEWAKKNKVDIDNLIDVLESNSSYCDCEVIMNLPEDCDLEIEFNNESVDINNIFKIPSVFQQKKNKIYTKAIFSYSDFAKNNYSKDGELLIPAPYGFIPKKRVKKSIHFFNGIDTELPNEIGIVKEIEPITSKEFANKIRELKIESFFKFSERDADYYFSQIEKIDCDKPVGTYFMERTGIGGTKIELKIHKIIFRK